MDHETNRAAKSDTSIVYRSKKIRPVHILRLRTRRLEKGATLLALIIGLGVLAILITMTAQTQKAEFQHEQEADFLQRGYAIAEAIARFNNRGHRGPLNPGGPFPQTLEDLVKSVDINGRLFHFLRPSALRDPFSILPKHEWRVIRAGDPAVREYLQTWAVYYGKPIPANYQAFTSGANFVDDDDDDDDDDDGGKGPTPNTGNNTSGTTGTNIGSIGGTPGMTTLPIIGVIGSSPKPAFRQLLGRDKNYNEYIFLYLQDQQQLIQELPNTSNNGGSPQ